MNSLALAQSAYGDAGAAVRTDRSVEYQAFAKVTAALTEARDATSPDFVARVEALHLNRQLWTILGNDVAEDNNALPIALRKEIFSLSRFVTQQTPKVMDGSAEIDALIDINTAIMRGLRGEGGQ